MARIDTLPAPCRELAERECRARKRNELKARDIITLDCLRRNLPREVPRKILNKMFGEHPLLYWTPQMLAHSLLRLEKAGLIIQPRKNFWRALGADDFGS